MASAYQYPSTFIKVLILVSVSFGMANSRCDLLRIMVPAYFDPTANPQAWASLNSAASKLPNKVYAIANPSNGPGSAAQSSYQNVIKALGNNSGTVLGYVFTSYGNRSLAAVKADVDKWYSFYTKIGGIFFDEVSNIDGNQSFYQSLYNYVKTKNASALVVNNPGGSTLESYLFYNGLRVTDVICIFENGVGGLQWRSDSWTKKYNRNNFYALFYNVTDINVSSFDYRNVTNNAYTQNAGWVYVTSSTLPNPWNTTPSYFNSSPGEVKYIADDSYC